MRPNETHVCIYVVCNQAPGPSVLGAPDLILGVQTVYVSNVNILTSQPPRTSNNVQNRALNPTTSS